MCVCTYERTSVRIQHVESCPPTASNGNSDWRSNDLTMSMSDEGTYQGPSSFGPGRIPVAGCVRSANEGPTMRCLFGATPPTYSVLSSPRIQPWVVSSQPQSQWGYTREFRPWTPSVYSLPYDTCLDVLGVYEESRWTAESTLGWTTEVAMVRKALVCPGGTKFLILRDSPYKHSLTGLRTPQAEASPIRLVWKIMRDACTSFYTVRKQGLLQMRC